MRLRHAGNLGTGYAHMSRIAVSAGQQIRRGQVIGYVGSTGLSTGPHLHYEMYRGGQTVDPATVRFVTRAELTGRELADFRAHLQRLQQVAPGAALAPLMSDTAPMTSRCARSAGSKTAAGWTDGFFPASRGHYGPPLSRYSPPPPARRRVEPARFTAKRCSPRLT